MSAEEGLHDLHQCAARDVGWRHGRVPPAFEPFRRQDQRAFYDRLRRNGPRAYDEFRRAEEFWRQQPEGTTP